MKKLLGIVVLGLILSQNTFAGWFDKKIKVSKCYDPKKYNSYKHLVKEEGPLQFVVDIVPTNIFEAASNNRNMLQVIFFAILFGIAIVMLPKEKTVYVKGFFDGINDIEEFDSSNRELNGLIGLILLLTFLLVGGFGFAYHRSSKKLEQYTKLHKQNISKKRYAAPPRPSELDNISEEE